MAIGDTSTNFAGRGYHDHNAGAEEMSLAMRRWEWGRVHIGDRTHVYYASTPQPGKGEPQSLWITCVARVAPTRSARGPLARSRSKAPNGPCSASGTRKSEPWTARPDR